MTRRRLTTIASIVALLMLVLSLVSVSAGREVHGGDHDWADPDFWETWARTDKPVSESHTARTWMWGPTPLSGEVWEPNDQSPGGFRQVQYFDKSRMEINDPAALDDDLWYVTNGLLVVEMVEGRIQAGNSSFIDDGIDPAAVNISGDPADETGPSPTYADIGRYGLRGKPARADGAAIVQRIDGQGNVSDDPGLAQHGVTSAYRVQVPGIDHQVASPFWTFMNSQGLVFIEDPADEDVMVGDGQEVTQQLFQSPYYATGLPITEAYWSDVVVGGQTRLVLWQCFERRCLTYTPGNPAGFLVEAGNVGQHYVRWRYPEGTPSLAAAFAGAASTEAASGSVTVRDAAAGITLDIDVQGLAPGAHGIHIHAIGDCSAPDFSSAGGHLNPGGGSHGSHAGDLPNLQVGADGRARVTLATFRVADLAQLRDADGSAVVIHANADDGTTPPDGGSGARIACAEIPPAGDGTATATATATSTATTTATATEVPQVDARLYLVDLGGGNAGFSYGCGDGLAWITRQIDGSDDQEVLIRNAVAALLDLDGRYYDGAYNALESGNMQVSDVELANNGDVRIELSGPSDPDSLCDLPRITEQIRQTALQFGAGGDVTIVRNGTRIYPPVPDQGFAWTWIDASQGGSISIPGEITIEIPSGALSADAVISVEVLPPSSAPGLTAISNTFVIELRPVEPNGATPQLVDNVQISARYDPSLIPYGAVEEDTQLCFYDEVQNGWDGINTTVMPSSDTAVGYPTHFSRWCLFI